MNQINLCIYKNDFAEFVIGAFNDQLCLCDFVSHDKHERIKRRIQNHLKATYALNSDPLHDATINQLDEYFAGVRCDFDLPLLLCGTDFQMRVWQQLQAIAYGATISYQDLAESIDNQNAVRAVGSANGANSLAIIVPCHRVIASHGGMGGYGGGLALKRHLLDLEQQHKAA